MVVSTEFGVIGRRKNIVKLHYESKISGWRFEHPSGNQANPPGPPRNEPQKRAQETISRNEPQQRTHALYPLIFSQGAGLTG